MRHSLPLASIIALAVAGCVPPPAEQAPPPPVVAPVPPPAPAPVPAPFVGDWQNWPLTPGTWRYASDARGSQAAFGAGNAAPQLTLRCDSSARRIILSRPGQETGAFTIRTTSTTRAVPVSLLPGGMPQVASEHAARDPLLDAMAFSRGRIVVEQAGTRPLVVPTYAEIGRVIEDCRR